jgi:hypothetical protein
VEAHLVVSPVLEAWERYPWAPVHAQVAAWARAAGFLVHDPLPEWRRTDRPEALRLPGDPLHYGPTGNERLGRFIAAALAPLAR